MLLDISITLFLLFLIALIFIALVRLTLNLTLFFLIKKYKKYRKRKSDEKEEKRTEPVVPKTDEELSKVHNKHRLKNVQRLPSTRAREFDEDMDYGREYSRVVDVVKPIGFWTSLILGQKLSHLVNRAHVLNSREHKGFWVSMVEAQARGAGRQKGRGRW